MISITLPWWGWLWFLGGAVLFVLFMVRFRREADYDLTPIFAALLFLSWMLATVGWWLGRACR